MRLGGVEGGRQAPSPAPMCVVVNIGDLRRKARRRLPMAVLQEVGGGPDEELTPKRNRADLDALALNEPVVMDGCVTPQPGL